MRLLIYASRCNAGEHAPWQHCISRTFRERTHTNAMANQLTYIKRIFRRISVDATRPLLPTD